MWGVSGGGLDDLIKKKNDELVKEQLIVLNKPLILLGDVMMSREFMLDSDAVR